MCEAEACTVYPACCGRPDPQRSRLDGCPSALALRRCGTSVRYCCRARSAKKEGERDVRANLRCVLVTSATRERVRARALRNPTMNLLTNLTLREIRSQYKRTALGRVWSLVNPLATIAIFSVIFGLVFRGSVPAGTNSGLTSFSLWIACGIIPWGFISNGVIAGMGALAGNSGLLTKVYFPRHVLITSTVLSLTSTFLTELAMLITVVAIAGGPLVLAYLPVLLAVVLINVFFVLGMGLLLSVLMVYFRDVQHIWMLFNQIWFYSSGIVFTIAMVREAQAHLDAIKLGWIPLLWAFEANPAYQFVEAYRRILFDFAFPSATQWLAMLIAALVSMTVGVLTYRHFQARIVEEL